ncbi:hypothetical protein KEJ19_07145 [Candidatus Bathyarchaeota archaeon]|nr:hypothetical protein [Candidatus Bathyarchaeota archaeon]
MSDPYARLFYELRKRLPEKEDAKLLEVLLEDMRRGGKEAAIERIRSLIRQLVGEEG